MTKFYVVEITNDIENKVTAEGKGCKYREEENLMRLRVWVILVCVPL